MFDEKYEVYLADTEESRRLHYRLRYRIYCEERSYESPHQFPDGLETDEADDSASHFLVRSKETGEWLATMRLILPSPEPFPLEKVCVTAGYATGEVTRGSICELSRLGIIRHRPEDVGRVTLPGQTVVGQTNASIPEIMFGLFRAAYMLGRELGFRYCLWLSTPSMVRLLKRFQLPMRSIGEPCNFHGRRQPHVIDVEDFWERMARVTRELDPAFPERIGYVPVSHIAVDLGGGEPLNASLRDQPYPRAVNAPLGRYQVSVKTGSGDWVHA